MRSLGRLSAFSPVPSGGKSTAICVEEFHGHVLAFGAVVQAQPLA